jgi:hypothetical protein
VHPPPNYCCGSSPGFFQNALEQPPPINPEVFDPVDWHPYIQGRELLRVFPQKPP